MELFSGLKNFFERDDSSDSLFFKEYYESFMNVGTFFRNIVQNLFRHFLTAKKLFLMVMLYDCCTKIFLSWFVLCQRSFYIRLTEFWKRCSDDFHNGCVARLCANLKNEGEKLQGPTHKKSTTPHLKFYYQLLVLKNGRFHKIQFSSLFCLEKVPIDSKIGFYT